tara:strand:+ start:528 stop:1145 length:618 start_codon:yes stop_codon:yes gene_type:complete
MNKHLMRLGLFLVLAGTIFYIGRFSAGNNAKENVEPIKYNMIGYYMEEDRNYSEEAKEIQSIYKTGVSTSKIKHLLIYINGMAKEYDVNYNLIKAVISTESAWNINARSYVNALGLMQVMRACAQDYKTPHSEMYDPYVNITVGTMYLSKLLKEFPDVESALVGYNEGPRHAKKYKNEYIYNSKYVTKVTSHMINYESRKDVAAL